MILEMVLLSSMTYQVTSYRSVPEQTDDTPFITSTGEFVTKVGCAVSQDQLGKQINYGDMLYVEVVEKPGLSRICYVNDVMNKRNKRAIDFWVENLSKEKEINVRRGFVYKIKVDAKPTTNRIQTKNGLSSSEVVGKKPS